MKSILFNVSVLCLSIALLSSCKKKEKEEEEVDNTQESTNSADLTRISENSDEAADDVINMFSGSSISGARIGLNNVCGATIDSTNLSSNKTITLTFDGTTPCVNGSRTRSGSITAQLTTGSKWKDAGAVISITFNNYKVTRISDGKYVTFNGSKTITNVNGGLVAQITTGTVTHRIQSSTLSMTFDDGTVRSWSTNRTRVISKSGSDYLINIQGNGSAGNYNNLAFWGTNRYGGAFYSEISSQLVVNTCSSQGKAVVTSGTAIHHNALVDITITYGVNSDGSAANACSAYGYKLNWTNNRGQAKSLVLPY
ncbi:MAG: hypothetical protein MUF42_07985 [Cytophagaceae bacterium]|jgi:hypothetical protein|nr:hypothetical protein [Cytophagaceae bacterium]